MTPISTHPGEILKEEFLVPHGMSARALAEALQVPPNRISAIIKGTRSVSADTAIRLGLYFRTTSQFWLNLQQAYDLTLAATTCDRGRLKPPSGHAKFSIRRRRTAGT